MSLIFNGTDISDINYNETSLDKVTFNNTIVWEKVVMPSVGQLITMDLGTTAASGTNNQYRVLGVDGTIAFVTAMYNYQNGNVFSRYGTKITIGSLTCIKYKDSELDYALNTTFYNAMNNVAKAAIQDTELTQDVWYRNSTGNPVYSGTNLWNGYARTYNISLYSNNGTPYTASIGARKVFALGVQDIINYICSDAGGGELSYTNLLKMLWNRTSTMSDEDDFAYHWLRSASATDDVYAFLCSGYEGSLIQTPAYATYSNGRGSRPAFKIDLSKVSWS